MDYENSHRTVGGARRGLATIAFLKARFDEGMDHLDMFQPFVDDAVKHLPRTDIEIADVVHKIRESTGLLVPSETVKTLLRRSVRKGVLERHGGRYFRRQDHGEGEELPQRLRELENAQLGLASRLREFATARGETLSSDDAALAVLMNFLDANHIGIVLGQATHAGPANGSDRLDQTVAAFVAMVDRERGAEYAALDGVVKGLIVQNALLLRDIPAKRHFDNLTVFLDTGVLLRALGYAGHTEQQVTVESLEIIRKAGARLSAFERTVDEVEGILRVYEEKLGTSAGVKSLRPTMLTANWLAVRASPADIRQEIALLGTKLKSLGVRTRRFPEHVVEHTENEKALANRLRDPKANGSDDARVWHDVEAVAAIMTMRAGLRTRQFRKTKFLFVSESSQTVSQVQEWYREIDAASLEPMVHFRSIANAAWILRPAAAPEQPMHQLVAVCMTMLRPSDAMWSKFVTRLGELVASGDLGDDESIAVLASEFTWDRLADAETAEDLESDTVREIVERVREQQETELRAQLADVRRQRDDGALAVAEARRDTEQIAANVREGAERLATCLVWGIYGLLAVVAVVGAWLRLPSEWSETLRADENWWFIWWVCVLVCLVLSMPGLLSRKFHVLDVFDRLKRFLTARLTDIFVRGDGRD